MSHSTVYSTKPGPNAGLRLGLSMLGLACCGLGWALSAGEPSWPRFRGPLGDSLSTETGLLKAWPEAGPPLLWTATGIGEGYASVTVAEGLVCTAGDIDKLNVVTALDLAGKPLWRFENGAVWQQPVPGARCTPTIDRGRIYHLNGHGSLVCLDAKTGQKQWGRDLVAELGGRGGGYGYAESLILDGDRLICSPGGDTAMAALDAKTGETVWKSPSAGEPAGYATPILAECQGLRLLLTMSERSLIGINADTGDLLFRFEHVNPRYVANCVTPVYHDGHVFISCGYGVGSVLLKITVADGKASVEPVWRNEALDNRHGGVVLLNGFLYGASQQSSKGKWCCLEWETGRLVYAADGVGEGSLTVAEGMLYILSERGRMGLAKASPAGHEVVSQFSLPAEVKGASWAHPVICGGRLYVRHGDRLYAYDVRAR
jgi:outer membrane protein assembly factor BamB